MKPNIIYLLRIMRKHRKACGMNLEKVSGALEIGKSTLSEMENGKSAFTFERWLHWCAVVKASPSDVLKQWEATEAFAEITKERRNGFHELVDNMIKYGFGFQLDGWMGFFHNVVEEERKKRRNKESKREIKKYFPNKNLSQ